MTQQDEAKHAETLEVITGLVKSVVGDDWTFEEPITMETNFNSDLELESIEFVALAELMTKEYGSDVDFAAWLGGMEFDQIVNLTVGDVVRFVDECR